MYVGGVPPVPPPLPSRYGTKRGGLVSGARGLNHENPRKWPLQQRLLSEPRPQHQPLTPREQFAEFYGFRLPPPPPQQEDPDAGYPYECGGGLITTNNPWSRPPPPVQFRKSLSSSSAQTYPSPSDHDDLLAIFNEQFIHYKTQSSTPTPGTQQSPTKREGSILSPDAEGKLLVPDVKLKARRSLGTSTPSTRSPSRKPLSRVQDSEKRDVLTLLTLKKPSFKTRPWSYDGMQTYPVMKLPPKKRIQILTKIVDGEEKVFEIEVEVNEMPKRLFLFAPKVVPMH